MANEHFIKKLHIQNFKSLKDVSFDCRRVNVFLGKPNVGKSNILEAVTLLDKNYCASLGQVVRYDNFYDLFHMKNTNVPIIIESDKKCFLFSDLNKTKQQYAAFYINLSLPESIVQELKNNIEIGKMDFHQEYSIKNPSVLTNKKGNELGLCFFASGTSNQIITSSYHDESKFYTRIQNYLYNPNISFNNNTGGVLNSPYGENLLTVIESNKEISKEFADMASEYGLDLFIDSEVNSYFFVKRMDNIFYKYDKKLIADTFKRYMFYYAAIKSNQDGIILFEEPESNCYANYIISLAIEMMESKTNQFFVTTHSPHLVREFFNHELRSDLAVHICSFDKDTQETKIRTLTDNEVQDLHEADADLLLNLSDYEAKG